MKTMLTLMTERFPDASPEILRDFCYSEADHMVVRMGYESLRDLKKRNKGYAVDIMACLFTLSFACYDAETSRWFFGMDSDNQAVFVDTFIPSLEPSILN